MTETIPEMNQNDLQIGDRVQARYDYLHGNPNIRRGMSGTVCYINARPPYVSVCWDKNVRGHDCNKRCKYGYGWNVTADGLVLVCQVDSGEMTVSEDDIIDFMSA